ncbi:MAG: amidohydrolase family protein [Chloroflexi bacterium]|nr:amidohydrolase family protein [Chloroflexota bacterium]
MPDGTYELVGYKVSVKEGRATLPDGTLAGSTAMLNQCVRNVHQKVGVPLPEAVKMASLNPARAMGFADRLGSIAVGKDASLAVIDEQANVYLTLVKGRIVYSQM